MTFFDLLALMPYLLLALTAIGVVVSLSFGRNHRRTAGLTVVGLVLAFGSIPFAMTSTARQVTPLLVLDSFTFFYIGLLLLATLAVAALSFGYLEQNRIRQDEYYFLLLTATLGACILPASIHFISLFLGLELLTVSLYGMIAYLRTEPSGIEAAIKYLILAAVSASFLLFGAALLYAEKGTLAFGALTLAFRAASVHPIVLYAGLSLVIIGFGFKLAVVPFHMWIPDIYQGAPAPVSAFIATVSKGGVFAALLRFFFLYQLATVPGVYFSLIAIAVASMFAGTWLALLQSNVKRMLAYSSIAHFGYLLVALLSGSQNLLTAAAVYLIGYFGALLVAFGIVGVLSTNSHEPQSMEEYRALFWRRPWLAGGFTIALCSLIGIPITAGFIGKAYLLLAGTGSMVWFLAIALVVSSAIGLYYYLRVILIMASKPASEGTVLKPIAARARMTNIALTALTIVTLWVGVYPAPVLDIIQRMATLTHGF